MIPIIKLLLEFKYFTPWLTFSLNRNNQQKSMRTVHTPTFISRECLLQPTITCRPLAPFVGGWKGRCTHLTQCPTPGSDKQRRCFLLLKLNCMLSGPLFDYSTVYWPFYSGTRILALLPSLYKHFFLHPSKRKQTDRWKDFGILLTLYDCWKNYRKSRGVNLAL